MSFLGSLTFAISLSLLRILNHQIPSPALHRNERRTGLSRNTVRKYLRSDAVEARFKVSANGSRRLGRSGTHLPRRNRRDFRE